MSISLIVANLSVIMSFVYRSSPENSADDDTGPLEIRSPRRTRGGQDSSHMTSHIQIEIAMETYAEHPIKLAGTQEDLAQHDPDDTLKFPDCE